MNKRMQSWQLEDGIVKNGSSNIDSGVGIRSVAKPDVSSLDKKFFKKVCTSKDLFIISLYISLDSIIKVSPSIMILVSISSLYL